MNPIDKMNMLVSLLWATIAKLVVLLIILSCLEMYVWHIQTTDREFFCSASGLECLTNRGYKMTRIIMIIALAISGAVAYWGYGLVADMADTLRGINGDLNDENLH